MWSQSDWDEYVGWLEDRWPDLTWDSQVVTALRIDLEAVPVEDAMSAMIDLRDKGTDWITPVKLVAAAKAQTRNRAEQERRDKPQLPPPKDVMTQREWLDSQGYKTWDDAIRAAHQADVQGDKIVFSMNGHRYQREHPADCQLCVEPVTANV